MIEKSPQSCLLSNNDAYDLLISYLLVHHVQNEGKGCRCGSRGIRFGVCRQLLFYWLVQLTNGSRYFVRFEKAVHYESDDASDVEDRTKRPQRAISSSFLRIYLCIISQIYTFFTFIPSFV